MSSLPDLNGIYSYADYLKWTFEERLELIKGKIFPMSPAPGTTHQFISMNLSYALRGWASKCDCSVFAAPFDVRLPSRSNSDNEIYTVLQPDLCVICDRSKLDERGCLGAPDLVLEILSVSNSKKEMQNKYKAYEEAGVKEYWVVFPSERVVITYKLTDGKFVGLAPKVEGDFLTSDLLPGFSYPVTGVFELLRE